MFFNTFFSAILVFLFAGCAVHKAEVNTEDEKPPYPRGVEETFRLIESEEYQSQRRAALERYRKMRLEQGSKKRRARKSYRPRSFTYKKPAPVPPKKRIIHVNPEEMAIEIEQKLTYYCMKNRKSARFKNGDCKNFTANTLSECQQKYDIDDKNLLFCVEKKIRY